MFTCVIGQVRQLQVHQSEVVGASVDVVAEQMHADTPDRCTDVHLCDDACDSTGDQAAGAVHCRHYMSMADVHCDSSYVPSPPLSLTISSHKHCIPTSYLSNNTG